jgi:hypothetical protein
VSLSVDVLPEMREYERTSTTVVHHEQALGQPLGGEPGDERFEVGPHRRSDIGVDSMPAR